MIDTKKQSDNAFGKGLIMDSHPINADNNTLTNCLNGTMITYNGNEMMLQNDMGNGKVETAYLPAGYVPVGIKEHGGIVYVASYNPLTGKGQLGSFPSPERNISNLDMNSTLTLSNFDFGSADNSNPFKTLLVKKLINTNGMLRPGDEFQMAISAGANTSVNTLPQAGLKLSLAVKDSNGNLQDISSNLELNNDGNFYALVDSNEGNVFEHAPKQIYNGKTSGELYLIAELPSLDSFEVQLEVVPSKGVVFTISEPDLIQAVYVELKSNQSENAVKGYTTLDTNNQIRVEDSEMTQLEYTLIPVTKYSMLQGLARNGNIDFSTIGSGKIDLTEWKYYNDISNNQIYLNWGMYTDLRNYDQSKESIDEIKFEFYQMDGDGNFNLQHEFITKYRKSYNGNFQEIISYDDLPAGQVYLTRIQVNKTYNSEKHTYSIYRILYTSKYFNKFYSDVVDYESLGTEEYPINFKVKFTNNIEKIDEVDSNTVVNKSVLSSVFEQPESNVEYNNTTYPFYYKANQTTTHNYKINELQELTYENAPDVVDLPFKINPGTLQTVYTIQDDMQITNKMDQGNEQPIQINPNIKSSNVINNAFNTVISSDSVYVAKANSEKLSQKISGFRQYLNPDTCSYIFGYTASECTWDKWDNKEYITQSPVYGANLYFGRKDKKARSSFFISEYPNDNYDNDYIGEAITDNLNGNNSDRLWKSQILPGIKKGLHEVLGKAPNIFFIIGGECTKQEHNEKRNSELRPKNGQFTTDYVIPIWKGFNDENTYYIINEWFPKSRSTQNITPKNVMEVLSLILSNLYTKQEFVQTGEFFKSGDYTYTQKYTIDYTGTLNTKVKYNKTEGESSEVTNESSFKGDDVLCLSNSDFDKNKFIQNCLDLIQRLDGDSDSDVKIENNFNYEIEVEIPEDKNFKITQNNINIDAEVQKYLNASTQDLGNGVLVYDNGKMIQSDYNGNALSDDKIYYVTNEKAYAIDNPEGYSNNVLSKSGILLNQLSNFKPEYDPSTGMYHIRVIPGNKAFATNTKSSSVISSDNVPFKFVEHGQACILDIKLTNNQNNYIV